MVKATVIGWGSVLAVALSLEAAPAKRKLPEPVRGVVLALHDVDPRRSYRAEVRELGDLGINAVSIMPTWRMDHVRSARVEEGAATIAQIEETLAAAREQGIAVLVAPVIQISHLQGDEWRGVIAPPDWDVWFASYQRQLLNLADVAEKHGAAALLVGSELCSTEALEPRWRKLIAEVRARFNGSLAYQTNWDHRSEPTFLDALDLLATNAYFELVPVAVQATTGELVRAWRPFQRDLLAWAALRGKPLLITEVGYASVAGATAYPWDYTRTAPIDLEEQARGYDAFFAAWWDHRPGFFLYEWWGEGGPHDRGYTPRGKPALGILRHWLGAHR